MDDAVSFAERDTFGGEIVGQFRREEETALGGGPHSVLLKLQRGRHARHHLQTAQQGVCCIEQRLFVFLEVSVVGEREGLDGGEEGNEVADDAAGLAAHEFRDIRVALLGHDAGTGGVVAADADVAELIG